jgi:hypothetical protein
MEQGKGLKLFIGYSHLDNPQDCPYVDNFVKHLTTLRDTGLVEDIWLDERILAGEDLQDKITSNLENADVVCLLISSNFLSSDSCKEEKREAFDLWKKRRIAVIPIILCPCGWKDDKDISANHTLVLPTDGEPVSKFPDEDAAWQDVYDGLKPRLEKEVKIRQLRTKTDHENFLEDAGMLAEAHPQKDRLALSDIFVYPDLSRHNGRREEEGTVGLKDFLQTVSDYPRIAIVGEDQSGKTTICKKIFEELKGMNFIPVYISSAGTGLEGRIDNRVKELLCKQYEKGAEIGEALDEYRDRIVPIVDNFHLAKDKKRHIQELATYPMSVLSVDEIFALNIDEHRLTESFTYFTIKQLKPSLRNSLIEKWVSVHEGTIGTNYKDVDKITALIETILGKTLGKGIMPAYPFFVLSAAVAYQTTAKPLDQEITSQGYCYQAFIYFYLSKQGVKNDEIDVYLNFLTEFAYHLFRSKKHELCLADFSLFLQHYSERFNLPLKPQVLLNNLRLMVAGDSLGNWSFRHRYVYYFFVAKYLAEHLGNKDVVEETSRVLGHLHVDENAYIAVFIAHHSKNTGILQKLRMDASHLFEKYESATLAKDDVRFLDKQVDDIVEAALPPGDSMPEEERKRSLKVADEVEQSQEDTDENRDDDAENPLRRDLRRAIKTVEVMGSIMKNRAGSLPKTELADMFREAMNLHLRILSSFFDLIRKPDDQEAIIGYISEKLGGESNEPDERTVSETELRERARVAFWNINFLTVCGLIEKIISSLGSDSLIPISNLVCDELGTPASFLVKHGNLMRYDKNVRVDEIARKIDESSCSEVAIRVMKVLVVEHCYFHAINYRDRQRIKTQLKLQTIAHAAHD